MTDKNLIVRFDVSRWNVPMPILGIVASLLGLAYVIILPFVGFVSLILLTICRMRERLAAMWHKIIPTTVV